MKFLHLDYLWLLLLGIPLLFLHLKKVMPSSVVFVPSLNFWGKTEKRHILLPIYRFYIKIRPSLLFFLFLALIFALATPYSGNKYKKKLLIILDNSASMGVQEGKKTRLQMAKKIVRSLFSSYNCTLLLTAPGPQTLSFATLDALEPDITAGKPQKTLEMAQQLNYDKLLILTDGAGEKWSFLYQIAKQKNNPNLYIYSLGTPQSNYHIAPSHQHSRKFLSITIGAKNNVKQKTLHLWWRPVPEQYVNKHQKLLANISTKKFPNHRKFILFPEEKKQIVFSTEKLSGWHQFILTPSDAFARDNSLFIFFPTAKRSKVLIIADKPQPYLLSALGVYQYLLDTKNSGITFSNKIDKKAFDLAIVCKEKWTLSQTKNIRRYLFWGTQITDFPWTYPQRKSINLVWKTASYFLCQNLDLGLLEVYKTHGKPQQQAIFIYGNTGPLAWQGKENNFDYIYMGFKLENSNLKLLPAFPLFIRNVLKWSLKKPFEKKISSHYIIPSESDIAPRFSLQKLPSTIKNHYQPYRYIFILCALIFLLILLKKELPIS